MDTLTGFIGDLNTRLKRLESAIGSATDEVLRFVSMNEELAAVDYVYIYSKKMNDSFILGDPANGVIGVTEIGDRSNKQVLEYSGDGT
jgi:hypothetical protein